MQEPPYDYTRPDHEAKDWPYIGDYSGVTWNCSALFAHDRNKAERRLRWVHSWKHTHDFLVLEEAHVTTNRANMLKRKLNKMQNEWVAKIGTAS